jgi:magnesium transporter
MLIKCVAYENGRKIAAIPASEIHNYVCRPGCFVWVAMRDRDTALLEEMREQFNLHPLAVEDAQQGHQRPKIEEYGDCLFAVLHTIEPGTPDLRVGELDIFAGPNYVLSVRSGVEKGFDWYPACASIFATSTIICSGSTRASNPPVTRSPRPLP